MKKLYIVLFLLVTAHSFAQQDPQYTQYMYNMSVVNPAYAGTRENISGGLLFRQQWRGLDGAPETFTFFANTAVGEKVGLGLSAISDKIGPVKEQNLYADFAYKLNLGKGHTLSLGLKAGATFHDIGLVNLDLIDPNDPFFAQNINSVTPNVGAGAFYYTDNYYVAFSVPNVLSATHIDENGTKIGSETAHYFATAGYVFQVSDAVKFKPSVLVKSAFEAPTSFDVNANFLFYDRFEIGGSYRLDDSFSGLVNFAVSPSIRVGYAYDAVTSDLNVVTNSSHEIMLLFDLNLPQKVSKSPRFF
ncbi:type IX secretion system membrane protein, PorP/SprF family [Pustulibacterium marinum]|uniref:Type IX secretion system membrane protein, PorP/SprF family n=1 Tax=Pustulibacterium marinum TaxID=1224947 RepID=A0A1I7ITJ3_9FLAO|nr:type IX secretion system membrane protein PorP/SprF [Pustulibacterium marinum]SFU76202.1 type IX secretion system membrane protein, PorP/SprF family [Pustulibacterium marinum]